MLFAIAEQDNGKRKQARKTRVVFLAEKWRSGTDIFLEGLESSVWGPFGSKKKQ